MAKGKSRFSPFMKQSFVTTAVCSNVIGQGCFIGYPAVLLPQLRQPGSSIPLTDSAVSWIASVMSVTMLIGNFITPPVMDKFGRKISHITVCLPVLAGWFIMMLATSVEAIIIGRIFQGLSLGMMLPLRSVLIGEYSSPKNRGGFLTTMTFAQAFGIFFVHLLGSYVSWQRTAVVCVFFSFVSLCMTIYIPESPSWLAGKGDYDKCRHVFLWLRGEKEIEELDEMINARIHLRKQADLNTATTSKATDLITTIRKVEFYKPIIIMAHFFAIDQCAGGITMATFSTQIIGIIMGPTANVYFWMIALDMQRIVSNFLAVFMIHHFKRRHMTLGTGILAVGSHIAIASYVYLKLHDMLPYDAPWISIVLISSQFLAVGAGTVPLPSVITGEIFPLAYRSIGGSISLVFLAIFMFVILKSFNGLIGSIGLHGTYTIYASVMAYSFCVILYLLPETKGKTLQQIEDELKGLPAQTSAAEQKLRQENDYD